MNLQDARDDVANARKDVETDFVIEVASVLETLGTAVEVMQRKLGRLEQQSRAHRRQRFLSF